MITTTTAETAVAARTQVDAAGGWRLALLFALPAFFLAAGVILGWGSNVSLHSNDTTSYVHGAVNLVAGAGFAECGGRVIDEYPILYSALLAVPIALGLWPVDSLLVVGALSFAGIVFFTVFFARHCRAVMFRILCGLAILLSPAALGQSQAASSDASFTALVCLFLVWLAWHLEHRRPGSLVLGALLAGLIAVHRLIGTILVVEAGLFLLLWPAPGQEGGLFRWPALRQRIAAALTFGIVAALPLAALMARNALLTGRPLGVRGEAVPDPFLANLDGVARAVGDWFQAPLVANDLNRVLGRLAGWTLPLETAAPLFALALAGLLGLLFLLHRLPRRDGGEDGGRARTIAVLLAFVVLYTVYFCGLRALEGLADSYARYAFPILPMVLALGFLLLDDALARLPARFCAAAVPLAAAAVALWLVYPAKVTARIYTGHPNYLPGGLPLTAAAVRQADIVRALRAVPPGMLHANDFKSATFALLFAGACPRPWSDVLNRAPEPLLFKLFPDPENGMFVGRWRDAHPLPDGARIVAVDAVGAIYAPPAAGGAAP